MLPAQIVLFLIVFQYLDYLRCIIPLQQAHAQTVPPGLPVSAAAQEDAGEGTLPAYPPLKHQGRDQPDAVGKQAQKKVRRWGDVALNINGGEVSQLKECGLKSADGVNHARKVPDGNRRAPMQQPQCQQRQNQQEDHPEQPVSKTHGMAYAFQCLFRKMGGHMRGNNMENRSFYSACQCQKGGDYIDSRRGHGFLRTVLQRHPGRPPDQQKQNRSRQRQSQKHPCPQHPQRCGIHQACPQKSRAQRQQSGP